MKLSPSITRLEYGVYAFSLLLCFLLFKHSDLSHTNNSSFAYLQGHVWDFYDYNRPIFEGNNYLPVLYGIFALWNIPLQLFGQTSLIAPDTWMLSTPIQSIWSKLLLAIFFFGSVKVVGNISEQILGSQKQIKDVGLVKFPQLLFATSPIAIFSVFIFSGYDVLGLFFSLLGLQAYFSKRWKWFVFWFSIAISFKYFAVLIYLPLVLIVEKRYLYVVLYGILGLAFSALQFGLYWHSEAFHLGIFGMIAAKSGGHAVSIRFIIANSAYILMCVFLFFSRLDCSNQPFHWYRRAVFSCLLSYAFFFSWVLWHPQWAILFTPFICLSFAFIRSKNLLLWIEILGFVGFSIYVMNNWAGTVDNNMLYGGALHEIIPKTSALASDFIGRKWMPISRTFFYASLYFPVLLLVIEKFCSERKDATQNTKNRSPENYSPIYKMIQKGFFRIRFLIGAYLLLVLSIICLLHP